MCERTLEWKRNEVLYKQVDGAPMGGCVSPVLANIFLSYHENIWLQNCPSEFKPVLYKRYVDDTFLLFKSENHIRPFLDYLNSQHQSIKFTHETETNGQISFLDVKISKNGHRFETDLFRKNTFTGLGMNYESAVSNRYKYNLVECLVDRAFKICSSISKFNSEINFLKRYFYLNGFPNKFVTAVIGRKVSLLRNPSIKISTVSKKPLYISIPFISHKTNSDIKKELRKLVSENYPQLSLRIIFANTFTIRSFFNFKDRVPTELLSNLVYRFNCSQCQATYIGETSRHLHTRMSEHRGISPRTLLQVLKPKDSRIRDHSEESNHTFNFTNFKVLKICHPFDLELTESVLIHKLKPNLNRSECSVPLKILS